MIPFPSSQLRNLLVAVSGVFALVACSSPAPTAAPRSSGQLQLKLASGLYHCDEGVEIAIERSPSNPRQIALDWKGQRFALDRNNSASGLPRYEHRASGLVWIDLPWKGMLLDSGTGRPLASECRVS
ncbi:MAG: hypothetical protein WBP72_07485 [Rhodocyclaceae bacterium]